MKLLSLAPRNVENKTRLPFNAYAVSLFESVLFPPSPLNNRP
ncbi:MAG: hypothetical protein U1D30_02865 [Planctomycetota bacterium]